LRTNAHIYIDVGSNIGVQIRKLYEPRKYKGIDPNMKDLAATFGLVEEPTETERMAGLAIYCPKRRKKPKRV
jgi:transposase